MNRGSRVDKLTRQWGAVPGICDDTTKKTCSWCGSVQGLGIHTPYRDHSCDSEWPSLHQPGVEFGPAYASGSSGLQPYQWKKEVRCKSRKSLYKIVQYVPTIFWLMLRITTKYKFPLNKEIIHLIFSHTFHY